MNSTHAKLLAGALTLGATLPAAGSAQAGFDPTYGVSGIAMVPLSATSGDRFLGSTPGPGGTTFAVGFKTAPGSPDQMFAVAKLRSDGSKDLEFGDDGVASINLRAAPFAQPPANADGTFPATPTGTQEIARGVLVQSDGKIVITGQAETPASPTPFDSRDVDVYAVRFNADGTLDESYGGPDNSPDPALAGVSRINMTNGDAAANTLLSDNAWGSLINPDDTVVIEASRGTDIGADSTKVDRDVAMIKLTTDGALDTSFNGGAGGVDGISIAGNTVAGTPLNDNARRPKLTSGGRIVAASYGSATGIPNTPAVYRFLPGGALDTSYNGDGIGTGTPLGPAPAFSEAYDVAIQEGERYILTGYGNTGLPGGSVDMVSYRFQANGDLDPSYGTGGLTRYDAGIGQEDRGRDINVTSEGRIVIAGSSSQGPGDLIAAIYLLRPNGRFETSFGVGGALKVDLGGTGDAFFGLSDTASDTRATVAGYKAVTGGTGDDAAIVRVNLDLENTGPAGAAGRPGPAGAAGTTPSSAALVNRRATIGSARLSGSVVSVPLSCVAGARCAGTVRVRSAAPVRIGRTRKLVTVTRLVRFDLSGKTTRNVRLTLTKDGRTALKRAKALRVKVVVDPASGSLVTKSATLRR
jgi:uncharacterized delta-60 repeat protein